MLRCLGGPTTLVRLLGGAVAALSLVAPAAGQAVAISQRVTVIDFEEYAEGTPISTQYASLGVVFSIQGSATYLPVTIEQGDPYVGFVGSASDTPVASGLRALADPDVNGDDPAIPEVLLATFTEPVTLVRIAALDIERGETMTMTAFDGERVVATASLDGSNPLAGNGSIVPLAVSAASITKVRIEVTSPTTAGWGIDAFSFVRPCYDDCGPRFRIAQESAPGAADWAPNIRGIVPMFVTDTPGELFYAYGLFPTASTAWNGIAFEPKPDAATVFGLQSPEGLCFGVLYDRAGGDATLGRAETQVLIQPVAGTHPVMVATDDPMADDPAEQYTIIGSTLIAVNQWNSCCSDGFIVNGLRAGGSILMHFGELDGSASTSPLQGLKTWQAIGPDGSAASMDLVLGRRILIDVIPPESCPADVNDDGKIDALDLSYLLSCWSTFSAADLDHDGTVGSSDLAIMLGSWGSCP